LPQNSNNRTFLAGFNYGKFICCWILLTIELGDVGREYNIFWKTKIKTKSINFQEQQTSKLPLSTWKTHDFSNTR